MLNDTTVAVRGNVATPPVLKVITETGTSLCSFRLAVTAKRYVQSESRLVDVDTSFYTVTCWRTLADNVIASINKGDGLVVLGRLKIREFTHDGVTRTSADIVAEAVGHDLLWGTTSLTKVSRAHRVDPDQIHADALATEVALGSDDPHLPTDPIDEEADDDLDDSLAGERLPALV